MSNPASPEHWLTDHGDALYGFAYMRLRDQSAAEDVVQDTLLAAWRARESFAGDSNVRTWLIGILKHKLADHWRRNARQGTTVELDGEAGSPDDVVDHMFNPAHRSHWRARPSAWNDPDTALEQQQFWQVLIDCISALPPAQAQAFSLCELDGLKGEEACKVMQIAPTNLWVMLHRARLRLRRCLEMNWFADGSKG